MTISPDVLAAEFDMYMQRAGITVPAERRAEVLPGFADLRSQLELLRNSRTAVVEPANIFRLQRIAS